MVYLRHRQQIHGLDDLDLLEVMNSAGAELLRNTLEGHTIAVAKPTEQKKMSGADTVVIPRIPVDQYGKPHKLMTGIPGHKRNPGNETAALNND